MNDIFLNIHPWNLVDFSNGGKKIKNWNELHLMNEIKSIDDIS
jgi:hypothetical protein